MQSFSFINSLNSCAQILQLQSCSNHFNDNRIFQLLFSFSMFVSSLVYLNLGDNQIPGVVPSGLGSIHSLSYLDLSYNAPEGLILEKFQTSSILHVCLYKNKFRLHGCHPKSLWNFCSLQTLSLGDNLPNGLSSIFQAWCQSACSILTFLPLLHPLHPDSNLGGDLPLPIDWKREGCMVWALGPDSFVALLLS